MRTLLAAALATFAMSCTDPVHDLQVKALGGEKDGVPTGEFHRAGQPCLVCHGDLGPAHQKFSMAGTIFNGPYKPLGEDQVVIELIDALGFKPPQKIQTNCVGNFYITPDVWTPSYPVLVRIRKLDGNPDHTQRMQAHIGREGSCNYCHKDPISFDAQGHVYLFASDQGTPPPDCPVSPIADIPGNRIPDGGP
jgi:hypothetical protein